MCDGINTLSRPQTVLDKPGATALNVLRGEVKFENVRSNYGSKKAVIDNFNLHIKPDEKIGLVGRSGAGKSTLVNLLLRFYDVESGLILIDGQDIALAQQDKAADFIAHLVDAKGRTGFNAYLSERGVKLSGGQRQRVAIARVMLKDAPFLLLDEATSALDLEVEAAIQQSLYRLMEGKTVVAIAHRLSTIAAMDRLIEMDQGSIVEEGSHAQLLAHGGLYARLWAHQSGGFGGEHAD